MSFSNFKGTVRLRKVRFPPTDGRNFKIIQHAVSQQDDKDDIQTQPVFWVVLAGLGKMRILGKNSQFYDIAMLSPLENAGDITDFLRHAIKWLHDAAAEGCFDKMIICASPAVLQEIRKYLTENLAPRLVAQLDSDFSQLSETELKQELAEILWFV